MTRLARCLGGLFLVSDKLLLCLGEMRHRARELLAGQRTAALNALRGHLAEIGLIAPQGEMAILVVEQYFEWARDIARLRDH